MPAPRRALNVNDANDLLKAAGLRKSFTRIVVLQCLSRQAAPLTHAEICAQLSSHGFDPSTVFRALNDLAGAAIVSRLDIGDRSWRYELRTAPRTSPIAPGAAVEHPHVVCRICGRIACLSPQQLPAAGDLIPDWRVEEILYRGVCRNCDATAGAPHGVRHVDDREPCE